MRKFNKVLIIEDDFISSFLLDDLLKKLDIASEIIILEKGKDAFEFIKHYCIDNTLECPNLILLDLNIPDMDGFTILKKITEYEQSHFVKSKIAVVTSILNAKSESYLKDLGIENIFIKPLKEEHLLALMN